MLAKKVEDLETQSQKKIDFYPAQNEDNNLNPFSVQSSPAKSVVSVPSSKSVQQMLQIFANINFESAFGKAK